MITKKQEQILINFHKKLLSNMKHCPYRYQKMVDDNFWSLLAETPILLEEKSGEAGRKNKLIEGGK